MKIEIILLGVIGLVFLVDFIKNLRKMSSIDNVVDQIEGEEPINKVINKNPLTNILKLSFYFIILNIILTLLIMLIAEPLETYGSLVSRLFNDLEFTRVYLMVVRIEYKFYYILINLLFILYVLYNSQTSLNYILKRKKNFTIYILSIPVIKVLIHFFIYTERIKNSFGDSWSYGDDYDLAHHIDGMFMYEIWLFIPAFIFVSLVVWFFNDKIKAR